MTLHQVGAVSTDGRKDRLMAGGVCVRASRGHWLSDRFAREGVPESFDKARQGNGNRD